MQFVSAQARKTSIFAPAFSVAGMKSLGVGPVDALFRRMTRLKTSFWTRLESLGGSGNGAIATEAETVALAEAAEPRRKAADSISADLNRR